MTVILAFVALATLTSQALAQSPLYGQCGGQGWTGPTTCVSGATCVYSNAWYSQCLPGGPTSTTLITTNTPTTTPTGTVTTTGTNPGNTGACTVGSIPASPAATANSRLPDLFKLQNGSRMTTKAQWACRREEIRLLLERTLYGEMPAKPNVTASFSGNTLTINVSAAGKSISFTASISKPSGSGPFPAIIALGGFASLPISSGIATINYNVGDIAVDGTSHGGGKFYTLYGTSASAGALVAWAWGASRIIDALELVPGAGIDPKRVGVTGCSRYGKGALAAGAWDTRIALTLPQESGTGGMSSYRIATAVDQSGTDTEQLNNIVLTATNWLAPSANSWANSPNNLPIDNHLLTAMVAPRPLLSLDNDIAWLGPRGAYGAASAARKVWQALGVQDYMGLSQIGGHNHCSLPSSQNPEVAAFQTRFLLKGSANTSVFRSSSSNNFGYVESQWVDWTVPTLS